MVIEIVKNSGKDYLRLVNSVRVTNKSGYKVSLPVKENQPTLRENIELYFSTEKERCEFAKTSEKAHGRYERRECYATMDIGWLPQKSDWAGLSGIGMIVSTTQTVGAQTVERAVHYVIYSKADMSAAQLLAAKRTHWSVENSVHWVLDVDFGEDHMRMREGFAAENMNVLRHLAINLLNSESSYKASSNLKRKRCALSHNYLLKVFS